MRKRTLIWMTLGATGTAFLLMLYAAHRRAQRSDVVAWVGGSPIPLEYFETKLSLRSSNPDAPHVKRAVLDEILRRKILAATAVRSGILDDPVVAERVENLLAAELRARAEEHAPRLQAPVPEATVREHYEATKHERYRRPPRLRYAVLEIAVPPKASPEKWREAQEQAEHLRAQALALPEGARGFGYLAARHSADQATRYMNGDCGWLAADATDSRWGPELTGAVRELVTAAEPVSAVLRAADGFYLFKRMAVEPETFVPFETVAANVRQTIVRERREQLADALYEAALRDTDVRINEDVLRRAQPAASPHVSVVTPPALPAE